MTSLSNVCVDADKLVTEATVTVDGYQYKIISPWDSDRYDVPELTEEDIMNMNNNPDCIDSTAKTTKDNEDNADDGGSVLSVNSPSTSNLVSPGEREGERAYDLEGSSLLKRGAIRRIKRLMKDNLYERRILSKSGLLEGNRLAHHKTSKRLFSKREENKGKEYYIDLLLDCSGSMRDESERACYAIKGCLDIGEILESVAHIRVMCFGAISTIYSYKEFKNICEDNGLPNNISIEKLGKLSGERGYLVVQNGVKMLVNKRKYLLMKHTCSLVSMIDSYGATDDLAAIVNSYHSMRKQDGDRCIIVMLDGEYSPYGDGDDIISMGYSRARYNKDTYRDTISTIQKEGIGIYALAIQSRGVHDVWGEANHKLIEKVDNPSDIYSGVCNIITKFVKGA